MTVSFDNAPFLNVPGRNLIDPAAHIDIPRGPITKKVLLDFFAKAFLPNAEAFVPTSDFGKLRTLQHKSHIKHIHEKHPDGPLERIRILDLASGDAPYLRHLFGFHNDHECEDQLCARFRKSIARSVSYVCVNYDVPKDFADGIGTWSEKFRDCFESIELHALDLCNEAGLNKLVGMASRDAFDRVILSNAWHELPADCWPNLLSVIPDLLKKDGKFMLLDLEHPMMLRNHRSMYSRVATGLSFWEASALYLSQEVAERLMADIGLILSHTSNYSDLECPWWWVEGKKTNSVPRLASRRKRARATIETFIVESAGIWRKRSRLERNNVVNIFSKTSDPSTRLFTALQYLCLAASQAVRDEFFEAEWR